jgi:hypothetical protein
VGLLLHQFDLEELVVRVGQLAGQELLQMLVLVDYTAAVVVVVTAAEVMGVLAGEVLFVLFGAQIALFLLQILGIFNGSFYAPRWRNGPL